MANIPVALQLFAVRGECDKDLPAALAGVAKAGYAGAEPWGFGGENEEWKGYSGAQLRRLFDDNGLVCCGMHLAPGALQGDNLERTAALNAALGNRFLIIAGDSRRMASLEGVAELTGILNEAAERLAPHGMFAGYHAHHFDFGVLDGKTAWERLFEQADPRVIMQMDTGNCASGGGDPLAILRRFPGRARSVHLKEFGGPDGAVIGEGTLDFAAIFEVCETQHPTEWYVVEEGGPEGLGFDVCARSRESLRRMGK